MNKKFLFLMLFCINIGICQSSKILDQLVGAWYLPQYNGNSTLNKSVDRFVKRYVIDSKHNVSVDYKPLPNGMFKKYLPENDGRLEYFENLDEIHIVFPKQGIFYRIEKASQLAEDKIPLNLNVKLCDVFVDTIVFVNQNATGKKDGSSWQNAYTDLNTALKNCKPNQQIWVAKGIYKPDPKDRMVSFDIPSNISVYGGFLGTEKALGQRNLNSCFATVLSGDLKNDDLNEFKNYEDNSNNIVKIVNRENVVFDGFSIQSCYGNVANNGWDSVWWAMKIDRSKNILIQNCNFTKNNGCFASAYSEMKVRNCQFTHNYTPDDGGGLHLAFGKITISNCLIANNSCDDEGGGTGSGAGIAIIHSSANPEVNEFYKFINCTIANNFSKVPSVVGGINVINGYGRVIIQNSILFGNSNSDIGYGTIEEISQSCVGKCNVNIPPTYTENPMFVSENDFHLQEKSPYLNMGFNNFSDESNDLDLGRRILHKKIDLGCYEFGNKTLTTKKIALKTNKITVTKCVYKNMPDPEIYLTQYKNQLVENPDNYIFTFFKTKEDAEYNKNAIIPAVPIVNHVYYVKISNSSSCSEIVHLEVQEYNSFSEVFSAETLKLKDLDQDGTEVFNLNETFSNLKKGDKIKISYHLTEFEAQKNINPLEKQYSNTSQNQQISVRIEAFGCTYFSKVKLIIEN